MKLEHVIWSAAIALGVVIAYDHLYTRKMGSR